MKDIKPKTKQVQVKPEDLENSFKSALGEVQLKEGSENPVAQSKRSGKTRITIDLPDDLYRKVEAHKEASGQNYTFLIASLLRKFFDEQ